MRQQASGTLLHIGWRPWRSWWRWAALGSRDRRRLEQRQGRGGGNGRATTGLMTMSSGFVLDASVLVARFRHSEPAHDEVRLLMLALAALT